MFMVAVLITVLVAAAYWADARRHDHRAMVRVAARRYHR
jgi:hypothetical protein